MTSTTSPAASSRASSAPSASVSLAPAVCRLRIGTALSVETAPTGCASAKGAKKDRPAGEWGARAGRLLLEGWRQDLHRQTPYMTLGPAGDRNSRQPPKLLQINAIVPEYAAN